MYSKTYSGRDNYYNLFYINLETFNFLDLIFNFLEFYNIFQWLSVSHGY